ncbi:KTSC domain-containing protein [Pedobacter xixiisoli]|uniref:KTSC domain-containing protein n=1 Tax=Pedobacter xixiisoli TaxID=1476464 RepID=A0A285ZWY2_9SPHI|nr:KTSC domain-containing protein [Pedobacter xixiisoli]
MPSSVVLRINYHLELKALTVTFISGEIYLYENVPEKIYKEFKASVSKGNYLNRKIKKCYRAKKVL